MDASKLSYQGLYETLWVLAAFLVTAAACYPLYSMIRTDFFWFVSACSFAGFTYLRWVIFPLHSPLMFSFWFKVVLFFINVPIFLFVLRYFTEALATFDAFDFTYEEKAGQLVNFGLSPEDFNYLKNITILAGTNFLISIALFNLRTIQLIFKWRQVPQSLTS